MRNAFRIIKEWEAIGRDRLRAAKALLDDGFYRDSITRSYYAAYCAATSRVMGLGQLFAHGRQNPSHEQLPDLIANTAGITLSDRRKIRSLLRTLRQARENADYRPYAFVDRIIAQDAIHNAVAVHRILEIEP